MDNLNHESNFHQKNIEGLIVNVNTGRDFASSFTSEPSNLKITVEDVGQLKFPISKAQAKALVQKASHAPFGHREKTITDLSVRNVWEIKKDKIKIDIKKWNKTFIPILQELQDSIGLPSGEIRANLDKLLIYEEGQFFSTHQDSEKENNMLATLVIVLPSPHKGGALIVSHCGESKKYITKDFSKLNFFGHYSDCHHKIKKVTKGYRIALTYQIIVEVSKKLSIQESSFELEALTDAIQSYFKCTRRVPSRYKERGKHENRKFVYLLDYQYTPSGLSPSGLKNQDYVRFNALLKIADYLGLNIFLALADVFESWSCEVDFDREYEKKEYRNWYEEEIEEEIDEDDELEDRDSEYDLGEMIDSYVELNCWKSVKEEKLNYGNIGVSDDEIFMTELTGKFSPFKSEHEGYMGNYGNTLDRWYHRAAIVLWPKKHHFQGISGTGIDYAVSIIEEASEKGSEEDLNNALDLWSEMAKGLREKEGLLKRALKIAENLNNSAQAKKILKYFDIKFLDPDLVKDFMVLTDLYGVTWCLELLQIWHRELKHEEILSSSQYLAAFIDCLLKKKLKGKNQILHFITEQNVIAFVQACKNEKHFKRPLNLRRNTNERTKKACLILDTCLKVKDKNNHKKLIQFFCSCQNLFPIESLHSILKHIQKAEGVGEKDIIDYLHQTLEDFLAKGQRDKNDWSIKVTMPCRCDDCKEVESFLNSNTQNSVGLPLNTERRRHIHEEIESLGIYVSHETLRRGRPYVLVLKKLPLLFREEEKIFKCRKKILADIS